MSDSAVKLFFPLNRTQVPRQKDSSVKRSLADIAITTIQFANDVSHKYGIVKELRNHWGPTYD